MKIATLTASHRHDGQVSARRPLLVLSLDYPPNDGGVSRLAAGLVQSLGLTGAPARVVTLKEGNKVGPTRPPADHVEVDRPPGVRHRGIFDAVRHHLRTYGRDAPVLATLWNPEATLAILAGARRVTILAHGNEVMAYDRFAPKAWLRRIVLERARIVICNSRFTEDLVRAASPGAHTAVINPAVDVEAFRPHLTQAEARRKCDVAENARLLLTVARLDPVKGHATVFDALAELTPSERRGLIYAVVGQGWWRDRLEAQAHSLGLADVVRFVGFVADAELPDWYAAADLFLLCSVVDGSRRSMEGFGMALTEAQSAGLPVIGTRSGGIPDAVREGDGGWLIDERDNTGLAKLLRRVLADRESLVEQGQLAAQRMRREMTWPSYVQSLLQVI